VTGANGQVGQALLATLPPLGEITGVTRAECDLADPEAIRDLLDRIKPSIIVNAAAYTAVDKAENDADAARAVNAVAPGVMASWAEANHASLIHFSTDYVFDGQLDRPYRENDVVHPLSVYGRTKLEGEEVIRAALGRHVILRTCWVYGPDGANFLRTMLRLAKERDTLKVVGDQVGAPTSAGLIARVTATVVTQILAGEEPWGTYHLSAKGETSWWGYARHAIGQARAAGLPLRLDPDKIEEIPTSAYPTPAARPANSRLDTAKLEKRFAVALEPWQQGVEETVRFLAEHP
jgi:dTDP-4-dehydrorhamnose reductase